MSEGPRFVPPLRATFHCRHYSYEIAGLGRGGPRCAIGKIGGEPGAALGCMPEPRACCDFRADYSDEERRAWAAWTEDCFARLTLAVAALPAPIPMNSSGTVTCPNCGGKLQFSRWHRGAAICCDTPFCSEARFNIEAGADWPSRQVEPMP